MIAFDTNIWIYSHDARDPQKRAKAQELIRTVTPIALPWQVGCEFIAASRKLEPLGFQQDQAWNALAQMQAMADVVLTPNVDLWVATRALIRRHPLSFWDALLVAACVAGGVTRLYSEDLGPLGRVDDVELVNPF
jgi:predicted nucleic acid-binding protein